jgi:hypothetical protein
LHTTHIVIARKPTQGTVASNTIQHGTGGLNIDGTRVGISEDDSNHRPNPSVRNKGSNKHLYGTYDELNTYNLNTQGRFPANLIHDGSDTVNDHFPDTGVSQGGSRGAGGKNGRYCLINAQPEVKPGFGDSGSASRFFYNTKEKKQ